MTLYGDNMWGIASILWIGTGLMRAFGGLEKGTHWYLNQPLFWAKMAVFGVAALLELWPMATFIRWRVRQAKGQELDLSSMPLLWKINLIEIVLIATIAFLAAGMARGIRW